MNPKLARIASNVRDRWEVAIFSANLERVHIDVMLLHPFSEISWSEPNAALSTIATSRSLEDMEVYSLITTKAFLIALI